MTDDRDVLAPVNTRGSRGRKGYDRDDVKRPGKLKERSDVTTSLSDRGDLSLAQVAVLPQHTAVDGDVPRPVLRIDHQDSGWADRDVVDVGAPATRPAHVVKDIESVWSEQLELCAHGLLASMTPIPHLGGSLDPIRPLVEGLRLGAQALRMAVPPLRLLAGRFPRLHARPRVVVTGGSRTSGC